jgi:GPH family glycoside/pentoside/hexuronide:cation symporter
MDEKTTTPKQQNLLSYAITNLGQNLLFSFPATFLFHFFTTSIAEGGLGFSITEDSLRYLLIAIGLIIGIFTGPLFGYLSDRTHTRFGRRRIWMIIFGPLMAFSFLMLSIPFARDQFLTFETATIYLIIVYSIYSIFVNAFYTPYLGLMADITTPENRLKMSGIFNLQMGLGTALGLILPWIIYGLTKSWVMVCLTYSLLIIVVSMITIFTIKEPPTSTGGVPKKRIPYKQILKDKKFLTFESAQFCWNLAFNLVLAALPAIAAAIFGLETPMEFGGMAIVLLVILGTFFLMYIRKGDKWGKQKTMTFALLYLAIIFPLGTIFYYTKSSLAFPVLYQGLIFISLLAVGLAAIFVFPMGILLDIIKKDQEASYMGTNAIFMNASGTVGTLIIFTVTRIYAEDAFFIVCPILGFILLAAGLIFLFIPLDDKPKPLP